MNGANLVDVASVQGIHLFTVQSGSMEAGLVCEHFFKTLFFSTKAAVKSMLFTWTPFCKFLSAE
jgi:hypothetical protein